jgi:hypothetical protein
MLHKNANPSWISLCLLSVPWLLGANGDCGRGSSAGGGGADAGVAAGSTAAAGSGGSGGHAGTSHDDAGAPKPKPKDAGSSMADDMDAGSSCVSKQGGACGGNTMHPCTCAAGLTCTPRPGSQLPVGDVGGTCEQAASQASCMTDADCRLEADYCTGCNCVALATGQSLKPCSGPGVRCLADPCMNKHVACQSGQCTVR